MHRSGYVLAVANESRPHESEHLMVIFYDVLLIDKDPVLTKPHRNRRKQLEQLVLPIPGRADLVMREEVYFSSPDGPKHLQRAFASGITQRWEGFVLKPSDEPYFSMMEHPRDDYAGCWIKLKNDYIHGLGDTADFAVVGAGYDGNTAKAAGVKKLSWTHFHIACLENKEDVLRFDAKPVFKVVDAVNQCIRKEDLETLNQLGQFRAKPYDPKASYDALEVRCPPSLGQRMEFVFDQPFVFEVMGSGFDKLPNTNYFTLRFPRVLKIHWDRTFKDTVSLAEYEDMADQARQIPDDATSQEDAAWIAKLEQADRGKRNDPSWWGDSQTLSSSQPTSEASDTHSQSQSTRRRKIAAPASLVRVDTQEMLPGESRSQTGELLLRSTSRDLQATVMSLPTPPASSPEAALGTCLMASNVPDAGPSAGNSRKRNADTIDGDQHGSNPKRIRSTAPEINKATSDSLTSTKYTVCKAPLTEVVNPSLHRKASPLLRRRERSKDPKTITKPQDFAEKRNPPTMSAPQTPDPTPTEQSLPAVNDAPIQPSSSPPKFQLSTFTAPSSPRPTTFPTSTASPPLDTSLTNPIVLLSPSINRMPYLTENLLAPYHAHVFTDPLRFIAHDSSHPRPAPTTSHVDSHPLTPTSHPDSQPPAPASSHLDSESASSSLPAAAGPPPPRTRTRKLVLVESHRPEESAWLVREFARLQTYQDIEFFDWRVLEDLVGLREGGERWRRMWARRFEGRVAWEGGRASVEWIYDNS